MISFTSVSGHRLDLERPQPEDFFIHDIATGLSNTCRYAGQIWPFYSVAQHSLIVATLLPPSQGLRGLLHDGSEAYLCDLSRHLKHSDYLDGYREIEHKVQEAIDARFHTRRATSAEFYALKLADDLTACFEHYVLRKHQPWVAQEAIPLLLGRGFIKGDHLRQAQLISLAQEHLPDHIRFDVMTSYAARTKFMDMFFAYGGRSCAAPTE